MLREVVDSGFDVVGKLDRGEVALFERLPTDRSTDVDAEMLVASFDEFGGEECLLNVDFQAAAFTPMSKVVEEGAVESLEVDGYDVALVLYGFGDECFLPLKVFDYASLVSSADKSGGEDNHLSVRSVGLVDEFGCRTSLGAVFVDG